MKISTHGFKKGTGTLLAACCLAAGTTLAANSTGLGHHPNPFEKGAARLMERTEPERLLSETNNPVLAPLAAHWQSLVPELLQCPTTRSNHTLNLAIHRIQRSPNQPVLVFIHGVLSDHLTWEYLAAELSDDYEILLVDLPGCGDSDAPDPTAIEPDGYSPTAMGERVLQALRPYLKAIGPQRRITLVGHSLGGTVSIRMLSSAGLQQRYRDVLQRIDRTVLLAPCDLAVNGVPPSFLKLLGLKGWMVTAGDVLGVLDGKVRDLTKAGYQVPECPPREQQQQFAHVLQTGSHRRAAQAMLREFVPFDPKTIRPVWSDVASLLTEYQNISVPVLIVYGAWDETLSSGMGHQLKDEIPGAVLVKLPSRGHALPTEDPLRCAQLIQRFQQGRTPAALAEGLGVKFYPGATPLGPASHLTKSPPSDFDHDGPEIPR